MHANALVAPITDRLLKRAIARQGRLPMPKDSARQIASGPNPDRILVAGGGIAGGAGARNQELALPGRLAIAVSALTGRGAVVDVTSRRGLRVEDTLELLGDTRIEHYDAILLTLGASDSYRLTAPRRWRDGLQRLLDTLESRIGAGTTIILTSAAPLPSRADNHSPLMRARDTHARRLDEITERIVLQRTNAVFARTGEAGLTIRWNSAFDYDRLGRRLAPPLAERLDALLVEAPMQSARRMRDSSDPELLRQAALERTGLLRSGSTPVLDQLLLRIADRMGVQAAGVTLIDGDSTRTKAVVGAETLDSTRSESLCNQTIRSDSAHIEPDLRGQPAARYGWQFYAGFPLESPDGYRIGAVCLLDPTPRAVGGFDEVELAELATRVQNELWAEIAGQPSPSEDSATEPAVAEPANRALHAENVG